MPRGPHGLLAGPPQPKDVAWGVRRDPGPRGYSPSGPARTSPPPLYANTRPEAAVSLEHGEGRGLDGGGASGAAPGGLRRSGGAGMLFRAH